VKKASSINDTYWLAATVLCISAVAGVCDPGSEATHNGMAFITSMVQYSTGKGTFCQQLSQTSYISKRNSLPSTLIKFTVGTNQKPMVKCNPSEYCLKIEFKTLNIG